MKYPGEESYYCDICGAKNFGGVMDDSWPEDLPGQDKYCSIACAKAARVGGVAITSIPPINKDHNMKRTDENKHMSKVEIFPLSDFKNPLSVVKR